MLKISVIVTAYNKASYIAEALESIFNQTLKPHQVIVIDDGSTDNTLSVIQQMAEKYPIEWSSRANRGLSATLNEGVSKARHEFIAFLDADDYWSLDRLEKQYNILQKHPEIDGCSGQIQQFVSPELDKALSYHFNADAQKGMLRSAFLWRKTFLEKVGGANEQLQIGEFIDWYARAQECGIRPFFLETIVMYRRLAPNTLSQIKTYNQNLLSILKKRVLLKTV